MSMIAFVWASSSGVHTADVTGLPNKCNPNAFGSKNAVACGAFVAEKSFARRVKTDGATFASGFFSTTLTLSFLGVSACFAGKVISWFMRSGITITCSFLFAELVSSIGLVDATTSPWASFSSSTPLFWSSFNKSWASMVISSSRIKSSKVGCSVAQAVSKSAVEKISEVEVYFMVYSY